jgi:hypothetical protein
MAIPPKGRARLALHIVHGRSAVSISSFANGALGEHRRQDAEDHYGCGAGIGRMLDTFQPSAVFTATRFIRKRVGWAACPTGEIMNVIGT